MSQQAGDGVMAPCTIDSELFKGLFDTPFADHAIYDLEAPGFEEQDQNEALGDAERTSILRLDGASDPPPLPFQPPKPSPLSQTHFQIPHSLLSSKHAPAAEELPSYTEAEVHARSPSTPLPKTPGVSDSSEDSITSTGEWRHPPTRFQHLAKFVRPGNSLTVREKAAVEVWKAASEEQLHWIGFREKYERTVRELNDLNGDEEGDVNVLGDGSEPSAGQQLESGDRPEEDKVDESGVGADLLGSSHRNGHVQAESGDLEQGTEDIPGLSKRECHGKNLTVVLANFRPRGAE